MNEISPCLSFPLIFYLECFSQSLTVKNYILPGNRARKAHVCSIVIGEGQFGKSIILSRVFLLFHLSSVCDHQEAAKCVMLIYGLHLILCLLYL